MLTWRTSRRAYSRRWGGSGLQDMKASGAVVWRGISSCAGRNMCVRAGKVEQETQASDAPRLLWASPARPQQHHHNRTCAPLPPVRTLTQALVDVHSAVALQQQAKRALLEAQHLRADKQRYGRDGRCWAHLADSRKTNGIAIAFRGSQPHGTGHAHTSRPPSNRDCAHNMHACMHVRPPHLPTCPPGKPSLCQTGLSKPAQNRGVAR